MAPKGIRYQSLEPVNVTLYGKKGLCRHDGVKDFEMVRLSWIIQVSPKCGNIYLYRREGGRGRSDPDRGGEGSVAVEAKRGLMRPQAKQRQPPAASRQTPEEAQSRVFPRASGRRAAQGH